MRFLDWLRRVRGPILALAMLALFVLPTQAADLSVTAANCKNISGITVTGTALATITAGQSVYYDTTNFGWNKATAAGTALQAGSAGLGIALNGAASGQPLIVLTQGLYNPGGTVTVAAVYVVSDTAGAIAPTADITTSAHFRSLLGVGVTSSQIYIQPYAGPALP